MYCVDTVPKRSKTGGFKNTIWVHEEDGKHRLKSESKLVTNTK